MTKKYYELIASVLRKHKLFKMYQESPATYHLAVEMFASALQDKNPRFNKEKFLQACGVEVNRTCNKCHFKNNIDLKDELCSYCR